MCFKNNFEINDQAPGLGDSEDAFFMAMANLYLNIKGRKTESAMKNSGHTLWIHWSKSPEQDL